MKNLISERVEAIFSHAVAMDQSGRLRNTVYCLEDNVYILNSDQTVLLKFPLRKSENHFAHPVSFRANDYDSRQFYEEDGKIVFVVDNADFTRRKSCATPGDTPGDIAKLFAKYPKLTENRVQLNANVASLLDESLSHIEIGAEDGELRITQRNIYSGAVITLERKQAKGFALIELDDIREDFGPLGIRTNDFLALFSFINLISFAFPSGEADYCYIQSMDPKMAMEGIIALCVYDELGGVETSRKGGSNGREKQKVGKCERNTDSAVEKRRSRRTK